MGRDEKIRIGVVTPSISRKAGGLFVSVRRLTQVLQEQAEVDIQVAGLKDSFSVQDAAKWNGVKLQLMEVSGPGAFGYAPELLRNLIGSELDLIHTQGIWMYPSVAVHRWASKTKKPYMITTRGMLDPWAVNNAYWKKRIAAMLFEDAHLRNAACVHALCESEASAIRAYGLTNPICVVPNGVDVSEASGGKAPQWRLALPSDSKISLFLGRIHPKKGLPNLLRAWGHLHRAGGIPEVWHLVIAGWDQGGHEDSLRLQTSQLQIQSRVHFVGPQYDSDKDASYRYSHAFVLPSMSEGLPMAVLEGWSNALPTLMTPQCNLPEGFQARAALRIDTEPEGIEEGLKTLFAMSDDERRLMGERGRALVLEKFSWSSVAKQMASVYHWVLGHRHKPDCVICD